jgi:hypothetical protein
MIVELIDDATEFLRLSEAFRSTEPYRTNIIATVAQAVAAGRRHYEKCYWWIVKEDEHVVGIAMRTAPHGYVISPMSLQAMELLSSEILSADSKFPSILGPRNLLMFAEPLLSKSRPVIGREGELLYNLQTLTKPTVKGYARYAVPDDFDCIYRWMKDMSEETGLFVHGMENFISSGIEQKLLLIWTTEDGERAALAGYTGDASLSGTKIARVTSVFSPKHLRGNGYASGVVAHVTQMMLDANLLPMLFTQATNPTSNKIYQRLGYEYLDENLRLEFIAH